MFIFRQNLVPKHSSQAPAPVSLLALPLSLSASHHPLQSHWPFAFSVAASSPAFELSPTLFPLLPCPPLSLLLISRISVYTTTSAGRLSLTLASLLLLEHSTHCLIETAYWSACSPTDSALALWIVGLGGCQAACLVLPTRCWPHVTTLGQPRRCQRSPRNRSALLWEPLCHTLPKVGTISYAQPSPSWHVIVEAY